MIRVRKLSLLLIVSLLALATRAQITAPSSSSDIEAQNGRTLRRYSQFKMNGGRSDYFGPPLETLKPRLTEEDNTAGFLAFIFVVMQLGFLVAAITGCICGCCVWCCCRGPDHHVIHQKRRREHADKLEIKRIRQQREKEERRENKRLRRENRTNREDENEDDRSDSSFDDE